MHYSYNKKVNNSLESCLYQCSLFDKINDILTVDIFQITPFFVCILVSVFTMHLV